MVVIITVTSIIVFTKQPSAEKYLANFFSLAILWIVRKFLQLIKKKHPWRSLTLVKLQAFIEAATWVLQKMVFLERCSQNSQENTCVRDSILTKGCKRETTAQVFSCEFCEISKNTFFTEPLQKTTSDFNFSLQFYLNGALQTVFWKPPMNTLYLETLTLEVPFRYIISFSAA